MLEITAQLHSPCWSIHLLRLQPWIINRKLHFNIPVAPPTSYPEVLLCPSSVEFSLIFYSIEQHKWTFPFTPLPIFPAKNWIPKHNQQSSASRGEKGLQGSPRSALRPNSWVQISEILNYLWAESCSRHCWARKTLMNHKQSNKTPLKLFRRAELALNTFPSSFPCHSHFY